MVPHELGDVEGVVEDGKVGDDVISFQIWIDHRGCVEVV